MQPTKSGAERDEQYGCPCPIPIIATVSGHHQQIAGAKRGDGLAQLGAVGLGAARHFPEHSPGAGGAERGHLCCDALAAGRDPGIAVFHA